MFKKINWKREGAELYHRSLPEEIRHYLRGRGIPATLIEQHKLGWNGTRITIPVFDEEREFLGFRYAIPPADFVGPPEFVSDPELGVELYGRDMLKRKPRRVMIAQNEFDRLVLEALEIPSVSSTGGPGTFSPEWATLFERVRHVYVAFDRSPAWKAAAARVQVVVPRARIVSLPREVADTGTVSDFFLLGRTKVDLEVVLAGAAAQESEASEIPPKVHVLRSSNKSIQRRVESARRAVPLHEVVSLFTTLEASGSVLVGNCPLHSDGLQLFSVYPDTNTYRCIGCGKEGDVLAFLMDKESVTVNGALKMLECFAITHELYGAAS